MNGKVPQVLQELHFDETPTKGSLNPVTSDGVAEAVGESSSNLAPEYSATSTYPAGSYVIHGGVLYTNPNAIGTAEDWNPAHWTQTTVAEMVAGAGGSYTVSSETITVIGDVLKTLNDHEVKSIVLDTNSSTPDHPNLTFDCTSVTNGLLILSSTGVYGFRLNISKLTFLTSLSNTPVAPLGNPAVNVTSEEMDLLDSGVLVSNDPGEPPADISDISIIDSTYVMTGIVNQTFNQLNMSSYSNIIFHIVGGVPYVAQVTYRP